MLILLVELAAIFWMAKVLKSKGLRGIHNWLVLALGVQFLLVTIYRLELWTLGREVYYSDAEIYWNTTLALLKGADVTTWNMGYVYYCYLIQKTSPFVWAGFINLSNVLLIDLTGLSLAYVMIENKVPSRNVETFLAIGLLNPLVIYSLARNLKDVLFLFYVSLIILCFHFLTRHNTRRILLSIALIVLTILVSEVRPWGFLVSLSLFGFLYLRWLSKGFRQRPILFYLLSVGIAVLAAILVIFLKYLGYMATLEVWVPIVIESASSQGLLNLLLAPTRILTGPGPFRAIQGAKYFWFYTVSGNFFAAIGALLWWFHLGSFGARLITSRLNKNTVSVLLAITWGLFVIIYSLQYGGSLELRFRGVIYVLTAALVMSVVECRISLKTRALTIIITSVVFAGGLIFG